MTSYIDSNNYYLSKFFHCEFLNYDSFWLFYSQRNGIRMADLFSNQKIYSFLWEYADVGILLRIDEWKRAFRRSNIDVLPDAKLHTRNYLSGGRKVYLDCLETSPVIAHKKFKDLTAYDIGQRFVQIVTDENISFTDINLSFLELTDNIDKFKAFIRILDTNGIHALILNGYHHRGELLKVCIVKNSEMNLKTEETLPLNVFENTYVSMPFNW